MAILRERTSWKREKTARAPHVSDLTPDERVNVRKALRMLRLRFGSWAAVALKLGAPRALVERVGGPHGRPGAGVAIRVARLSGASIDDVLSGAWPAEGSCPMCGRHPIG